MKRKRSPLIPPAWRGYWRSYSYSGRSRSSALVAVIIAEVHEAIIVGRGLNPFLPKMIYSSLFKMIERLFCFRISLEEQVYMCRVVQDCLFANPICFLPRNEAIQCLFNCRGCSLHLVHPYPHNKKSSFAFACNFRTDSAKKDLTCEVLYGWQSQV